MEAVIRSCRYVSVGKRDLGMRMILVITPAFFSADAIWNLSQVNPISYAHLIFARLHCATKRLWASA